MTRQIARREFLKEGSVLAGALLALGTLPSAGNAETANEVQSANYPPQGFRSLFDGKTLKGWKAKPRIPKAKIPGGKVPRLSKERLKQLTEHTGKWTIEEAAIIGAQDPPGSGLGAYLVSEEKFDNFELIIDAKPDWKVDTGILVRSAAAGNPGYQVLVDHRPQGGLGGVFGNNLANLHGMPFAIDAEYDANGKPVRLISANPNAKRVELDAKKKAILSYAADVEDFLAVWKFGDWNRFKIRCEGLNPRITTWINGLKIAEIDTATVKWPNYNPEV